MNEIKAIIQRDFLSQTKSLRFLVLMFVCSLVWAIVFLRLTIMYSEASMYAQQSAQGMTLNLHQQVFVSYFNWINFFLICIVPINMMGAIASERREHTLELLMTAPIHSLQIIVAKFLSGFFVNICFIGLAILFPILLGMFFQLDWSALLSATLGLSMLCVVYTSIGLFSSAVTRSPVLAGFLGLAINMSLLLLTGIQFLSDIPLISQLLHQLEVTNQLNLLIRGEVHLSALVSAMSFAIIFVFLSERMLEAEKWR